ncbi:MAG: hypothetical protein LBQ02_03880 [Candidatus Nomurabacteria bacterium]|jgi:hypothetical protein|nr:hypothetical protein [Candidatus Nomurabacteria bacterium]
MAVRYDLTPTDAGKKLVRALNSGQVRWESLNDSQKSEAGSYINKAATPTEKADAKKVGW